MDRQTVFFRRSPNPGTPGLPRRCWQGWEATGRVWARRTPREGSGSSARTSCRARAVFACWTCSGGRSRARSFGSCWGRPPWRSSWWSNPWIYAGIGLLLALQAGFVYLPTAQALFGSASLDAAAWGRAVLVALVVLPVIYVEKRLRRRPIRPTYRAHPEVPLPDGVRPGGYPAVVERETVFGH